MSFADMIMAALQQPTHDAIKHIDLSRYTLWNCWVSAGEEVSQEKKYCEDVFVDSEGNLSARAENEKVNSRKGIYGLIRRGNHILVVWHDGEKFAKLPGGGLEEGDKNLIYALKREGTSETASLLLFTFLNFKGRMHRQQVNVRHPRQGLIRGYDQAFLEFECIEDFLEKKNSSLTEPWRTKEGVAAWVPIDEILDVIDCTHAVALKQLVPELADRSLTDVFKTRPPVPKFLTDPLKKILKLTL